MRCAFTRPRAACREVTGVWILPGNAKVATVFAVVCDEHTKRVHERGDGAVRPLKAAS